ncbi:MAG: dihydrofolate reductase family protein, partial [Candidatus Magasanikiibacteriota bacterium]
ALLRARLIDEVSIVIAPCLIGGTNTASLMGGESLHSEDDLLKIKSLELIEAKTLTNSYIHLRYKVLNDTKIDKNVSKIQITKQ